MAETTKVENKHQALKRFLKRKSACVCMVILIIMIIVCFIIPLLADKGIINMDAYSYDTVKSAPSAKKRACLSTPMPFRPLGICTSM